MFQRLFIDTRIATMDPDVPGAYGMIADGAIGVDAGRIAFVGPRGALGGSAGEAASEIVSLGGALTTPALVDCHTHLVFAGDRADEFERRLTGASYEDIALAGGGIASTVVKTRAASLEELIRQSAPRLNALMRAGVATVEIKSGYGLTLEDELKMLEAATRLGAISGARILRTLLGLHALPQEYRTDRDGYIGLVCYDMIPEARARGLVDSVDAYCEGVGFTREEVGAVFEAARVHNLPVKLHAEQLSERGGAGLAASFEALSADHLEYVCESDIAEMAKHGTVAVLLPGAFYFLRERQKPPIDLFRKYKVEMAVATDCNPGTSPLCSPTLAMNMAATLFGMTPEEAFAGMTRNGARALGLADETGMIRQGQSADIAIWRAHSPAEIVYWIGHAGPERLYIRGEEKFSEDNRA